MTLVRVCAIITSSTTQTTNGSQIMKNEINKLAITLNSFKDAAQPRIAAKFIRDEIESYGIICGKVPTSRVKQNEFIKRTVANLPR